MKKPFCNKCLQDPTKLEFEFMRKMGFEKCINCRKSEQKPVITTGVVLKK